MKSKQKSTLASDIVGILCGVFLVVVGVVVALSARADRVAGLRDSQIPAGAKTLVGTAEGRNGDITVQVRADGEKIYQIKVLEESETQGIGSKAIKAVPRAIYNSQNLQVDATSGATITSDAIKAAVFNALTEGEIDAYAFGYRIVKADHVAKQVEVRHVEVVSPEQWKADHPKVYSSFWADTYPDIYNSFMRNGENKDIIEYTEEYPQIVSLYAGYPFSYDYASARGHAYVLDDVTGTDRLHKMQPDGTLAPEIFQKANCFTCKSPVMAALVNETGGEAYSWTFEQMQAYADEPVGCYTCHADEPGEITITHTYLTDSVGDDFERIDAANLACGQCHNEYFFMPGTNMTTLPHTSLATMSPDEMLNFYNTDPSVFKTEEDGSKVPFYDFTNKISGVKVIKVQHPELETYLGEGSQHRGKFTCADCHMGELPTADGGVTKNHFLTSPLDNEALLESTCSECHTDLKGEVQRIQDATVKRTMEIADLLVELHQKIGEAAENGTLSDSELAEARALARDAQFYWDFVFVENSNGAHNSTLTNECLDKAEALTNQALGMFK